MKTADQFVFEPKIINGEKLMKSFGYVVAGMGGSQLSTGLVKMLVPELDIISHQNYGVPKLAISELKQRLFIFSSYSGNTEEVIDSYVKAGEMGLSRAVISIGGRLLELAREDKVAYVQMPDWGIQPRSALPLSLMSLLLVLGQKKMLSELRKLQDDFNPEKFEAEGKELAEALSGRVPIIYTAVQNSILGYVWKITFNETGKIPAFNNVLPELNHNEMNGFGAEKTTIQLSNKFYFLFLWDENEHPKIKKRMELTAKLYKERNLPTKIIPLIGNNNILKFFNSRAVAEFAAYFTAVNYGLEAEQIPMVEEFKKML